MDRHSCLTQERRLSCRFLDSILGSSHPLPPSIQDERL